MNGKDCFKRLFREGFNESPQWFERFCESVFREEDFIVTEADGRAASGLLLSPYSMSYGGSELALGYISCVATAREHRGKGLMHELMYRALNRAAERGMAICALVPATDRLYFLYDRFGFATVFYVDERRYTSLHRFAMPEGFAATAPTWETLHALETESPSTVLHSRHDFDNIMWDLELDGGMAAAAEGPDGQRAMAFATASADTVTVKYLAADSEEAAEAVLAQLRERYGERHIVVWASPVNPGARRLRSRGMARIVNAELALGALAAANPAAEQVIRVHDAVVPSNNAIFVLHRGECRRVEHTLRTLSLDVTADVLTRIMFSGPATGEIFGLTTAHPTLPLMLD